MVLLLVAQVAHAGSERYGKITVTVDEDTSGGGNFGYRVYPVSIANGDTTERTVTVRVPARSWGNNERDHLTATTRTFRVAAGGTLRSDLIAPAMPVRGQGAAVHIDGRAQEDNVPLNVDGSYNYGFDGVATVRVSRDLSAKQRGVLDEAAGRHDSGGSGRYSSSTRSGMQLILPNAKPVREWSGGWLTYAGLAEVVLTERDLGAMSAETSAALRKYVLSGGRLTVVASTRWPAVPGWPDTDEPQEWETRDGVRAALGLGELRWWHTDDLATTDDTAIDAWVDGVTRHAQSQQNRLDADQADKAFPVIEGQRTPVRGLLLLMVVFALLIGPVNVLVLSVMKKRMWLLWTVPLTSAVFSGAVIAYAFFSEGITPTARTTAVTLLDQTSREAVTRAMRGYYAPLTPGDGLRFGLDSAVVPQVTIDSHGYHYGSHGSHYGGDGRGRAVDTTHDQHLTRGWVAARVPAHLALTTVESRRERLDFERLDDGGLAVVNGLGVDVTALDVADASGKRYRTAALAAGQRVVLGEADTLADDPEFEGLQNQLAGIGWAVIATREPDKYSLEPGSYLARTATTPFVVDGLEGIGDHRIDATVIGRWEETR